MTTASPSLTLPNSVSLTDDALAAPPSNVQPPATITACGANYRACPTGKMPAVPVQAGNKRKQSAKSRPTNYFEDVEDMDDDNSDEDKDTGCQGRLSSHQY
jgi:hypothetical protein